MPTIQYRALKIPVSQLQKLKNDEKFIMMLQLGRYLNQLSFCYHAYLQVGNDKSPAGIRQSHNSILFICGIMHEVLKFIPSLGKEFKSYKSYQNGLAVLMKNKEYIHLKEKVLNRMRNGIVFHVFPDPIIETLEDMKVRRLDFLTSTSAKWGDSFFELSDNIALNYLIGEHQDLEDGLEKYTNLLVSILNLTDDFIQQSNSLVYEYVRRNFWKAEDRTID